MQIKVIVATHKDYRMPDDNMYLPVHVGRALSKPAANYIADNGITKICDMTGDNTGDNISEKNKNFCELTAMYWAWKNLDADYIGISHYRRHFAENSDSDKWNRILTNQHAEELLLKYPVILPKKRDYYIETTYQQYVHAHNKQDLDETESILTEFYPEYIKAYKQVMDSTKGHRFNMLVMRRDVFDRYCTWLFDILFKLEQRLDISQYSDNDKRVFGFVSERLLDVWIYTNNIKFTELPVVNMENQNWLKKGTNFLKRKFIGK